MSHRTVENLLGRLATDPTLRRRFSRNRQALLEELRSRGEELTAIELEALASTEPDAIDIFALSLDERLRKAEFTTHTNTSVEEVVMSSVSTVDTSAAPLKVMTGIAALSSKFGIEGICAEAFAPVRDAFARNLGTAQDLGASVCIFVDGECVVDLWGGYFDGSFSKPFGRHTIVQGYSSTKTMAALCALVLADRGELDLDAPIAKYWPEFAAEGKSAIVVKQILGHTAALCGWDQPMTFRDLCDWEKATTLLARQRPLWTPGRVSGYHGYTQGYLIGEVIRRITGRTIGTFLANDLAAPLGVGEDYYIGTPVSADPRVSLLVQGAPSDQANGNRFYDLALYNPHPTPTDTHAPEWRRAEMPAMNGHGNARGIATLQSVLASGHANGVQMMSDRGRRRVLEQQSDGVDLVIGVPCRWGLGYSLDAGYMDGVPAGANVAWWAGNGGSMSFVDLDARLSIGYVPNRWIAGEHETDRARAVIRAAYQSLTRA
jgi:CubicO group peptidase (beta-lactamase class C family)